MPARPRAGPNAPLCQRWSAILNPYTDYHYRVIASDGSGTSFGEDRLIRTPKAVPLIPKIYASAVHSEGATLNGQVDPGGVATTVAFEWGPSSCSSEPDPCKSIPADEPELGSNASDHHVSTQLSGLSPSTTYYYRITATNSVGRGVSEEGSVTTDPHVSAIKETCPNSLARQQTGAALVLDCRAYELVSAANAGGYDVESNLVRVKPPILVTPTRRTPRAFFTAFTTAVSPAPIIPLIRASTPTWPPAPKAAGRLNTSVFLPITPSPLPRFLRCPAEPTLGLALCLWRAGRLYSLFPRWLQRHPCASARQRGIDSGMSGPENPGPYCGAWLVISGRTFRQMAGTSSLARPLDSLREATRGLRPVDL